MQREKEGGREGEGGRGNELVIILHRQLHKAGGGASALHNCKDRRAVHRLTHLHTYRRSLFGLEPIISKSSFK